MFLVNIAIVLFNIFIIGVSFLFFEPYLKRFPRKKVIAAFIILGVLSFGGYFAVKYLTREVDFFEDGMEQLRANKFIINKVGDFQTYSYNPSFFKVLNNTADFDVELDGNDNRLFIRCGMKKGKDKWILSEIKIEKIIKEEVQ